MNIIELQRALTSLRLSGIAAVVETRILQAQTDKVASIDLLSSLVDDELTRRADRPVGRRVAVASRARRFAMSKRPSLPSTSTSIAR